MRAFTYHHIHKLTVCTALPKPKNLNNDVLKSIAVFEQTPADLGFLAAQKIIQANGIDPKDIGALVFLTKTPDYRGPATAMVLQNRLGISKDCIVYDAPTGNGGFENAINLGATLLSAINQNHTLVVFQLGFHFPQYQTKSFAHCSQIFPEKKAIKTESLMTSQ